MELCSFKANSNSDSSLGTRFSRVVTERIGFRVGFVMSCDLQLT